MNTTILVAICFWSYLLSSKKIACQWCSYIGQLNVQTETIILVFQVKGRMHENRPIGSYSNTVLWQALCDWGARIQYWSELVIYCGAFIVEHLLWGIYCGAWPAMFHDYNTIYYYHVTGKGNKNICIKFARPNLSARTIEITKYKRILLGVHGNRTHGV